MNFPGFYALGSAWLFLLLVPLILFYFLKLKRPQMEIPSLALWRQVLNDRRVNSPFQKFKRNLLLLLQLLLLIALILAAMQPYVQSAPERARYLPVLIDCSASMAARDGPGGQSRLELAQERVRKLIDNLLPDQRLSLIAVDNSVRRLSHFTSNKRVLRNALNNLTVSDVPSQLEDALRMTQALSRTVLIEKVLLFSDGNVPEKVRFQLPLELLYRRLPQAGANIGITALNARRSSPEEWDVFVRVEGARSQTAGDIVLLQNGDRIGIDTVVLEPGESSRLSFRVKTSEAADVELRLQPDGFDSLASDNRAYLTLPEPRPLVVYCPPERSTFRHALQALDGVELLPPKGAEKEMPSQVDLLVADQAGNLPQAAVRMFVGVVPEDLSTLVTIESGSSEVVDWRRSEPLLQHVQLGEVLLTDKPTSQPDVRSGDYEEAGYEILVHGGAGPLMLKKQTVTTLSYVCLFETDHSTLPYRVGFPIMVSNLRRIALRQASLAEVQAIETGILPNRELSANRRLVVTTPDGREESFRTDDQGQLAGVPASQVGRYTVSAEGEVVETLGASLLDSRETSLEAVDTLLFRELSVKASAERIKSDRPLWPILAAFGFGLLLVEWWCFWRRPEGVAA